MPSPTFSVEVRKKGEIPPPPEVQFEMELQYSALHNGQHFHAILEKEFGLELDVVNNSIRRWIPIYVQDGKPSNGRSGEFVPLPFDAPIVMYSVLKATNHELRMVIIGTTKKTYFVICRETNGYHFIIDQSSVDAKEAVLNLYINNLNKGVSVFNRTCSVAPGLFGGLFECVSDDLLVNQFTVCLLSGTAISVRIYLDSKDRSKNMISTSGFVQDLDINKYPSAQIQRGYLGRPKERTE